MSFYDPYDIDDDIIYGFYGNVNSNDNWGWNWT